MSLIEKLLDFHEKHAKTLVVVLFGLLVTGATSGGLWISALKSNLEAQGSIEIGRRVLIDERYRTLFSVAANEHRQVLKTHKVLSDQLRTSAERIRSITEALASGGSSLDSSQEAELKQNLLHEVEVMERVVKETQMPSTPIMDELIDKAEAYMYPPAQFRAPTKLWGLLLLLLLSSGLFIFWWAMRSKRKLN